MLEQRSYIALCAERQILISVVFGPVEVKFKISSSGEGSDRPTYYPGPLQIEAGGLQVPE